MFSKLLIANRGEIACRVIATARRLGIATVAVHSDADANARHVRLADEAVRIGPAAAKESYLSIEAILAAARATGAEAIHPGYGFLSENEDFAEACERAGIVFVGPPASAIRAMGSKAAAKALMEKAGVPLTPGYHGDDQDPQRLAREADAIGYPVLIKATAGGGGKGMRRVDAAADFQSALASCRREAANAFGDDRVLVERYVLEPRHIEIQVFADAHGGVVSLFERDCSVQRRHQKVLEEAPAPGMTPERRAAMGRAATEAARAVGYVGAGTVEFIADKDGRFWFMEMNTRLQVEHPVTEMITGQDLVEWQLRVAAGEPLPLAQDALAIHGHAIEARVYAEDPDRGFLPSTGTLVHLRPPRTGPHVRVDTGVEEGDAITPFYDPMIAKLIVHGATRAEALARMAAALAEYRVVGVQNNLAFLARLVATDSFAQARLDTALIEREQAALFPPAEEPPAAVWSLAAAAELAAEPAPADPASPWAARDGWRLNGPAGRSFAFRHGEGAARDVAAVADPAAARAVVAHGDRRHVFHGGRAHVLQRVDRLAQAAGGVEEEGGGLVAPMPGKVIALVAAPGAAVEKGATLLVLEAMKMEHAIVAPRAGTVRAFRCAAGEQVAEGAELVEFEAAAGG
jgi:3-methylcrotonyl-CoA carboxylase alpha subunit